MRKQFLSEKCAPLFLATLFLCLTACSSTPFTTTASTPTPTPHIAKHILDTVDSCSLVTAAQIEQIIKVSVTVQEPDKINGRYFVNSCNYNPQAGTGGVGIDLNVGKDVASMKSNFNHYLAENSWMSPKPISGLGDQAFMEQKPFPIVDVLKDNALLTVSVLHKMDEATWKNEEIQIARIAVQSL